VTVVVPTLKVSEVGNPEPERVVAPVVLYPVMVTAQLSLVVGVIKDTFALHAPRSLLTVVFEGHPEMEGAWLSLIVIVYVHVAVVTGIPLLVTVAVTVVVPRLKATPSRSVCVPVVAPVRA